MVRITVELAEDVFAAFEETARQRGRAVNEVIAEAASREVTPVLPRNNAASSRPAGTSWDDFFRWVDSLNLKGPDRFLTRDEIYDR